MRTSVRTGRAKVLVAFSLVTSSGRHHLAGIFRFMRKVPHWDLRIIQTSDEFTPEAVQAAVADEIAGFIITIPGAPGALEAVAASGKPVVAVNVHHPALDRHRSTLARVANDNHGIGALAAEHFKRLGQFNAYAYIHQMEDAHWSREREAGFREALRGRSVASFDGRAPYGSAADRAALACWLRELPKPAAVMAACDRRAAQVLEACAAAGLSVPQQVSLLGVDNDELFCEHTHPQLTSVLPAHEEMGFRSAEQLARMMEGRARRNARGVVLIHPEGVIVRESTAYASPSATLVRDAREFIRKNATKGIRVGDVVEFLGVSRRLAELRFREIENKSIHEAIETQQLEMVRNLLKQTNRKISLIAAECGFSSANRLTHLFKKRVGYSPRQWRDRGRLSCGCAAE